MSRRRELLRRKLLSDWYASLDEDTRRELAALVCDKKDEAVLSLLRQQETRLAEIYRRSGHSWLSDFGANVAGNAAWDGLLWLLKKCLK